MTTRLKIASFLRRLADRVYPLPPPPVHTITFSSSFHQDQNRIDFLQTAPERDMYDILEDMKIQPLPPSLFGPDGKPLT